MIPLTHPLASVREAYNAVFVEAEAAGSMMFYGAARAVLRRRRAVLGDLVAVARNRLGGARGPRESAYANLPALPMGERAHPLSRLARRGRQSRCARRRRQAFASQDVSISSVRQEGRGDDASAGVVTHTATDAALAATVDELRDAGRRAGRCQRHESGGRDMTDCRRSLAADVIESQYRGRARLPSTGPAAGHPTARDHVARRRHAAGARAGHLSERTGCEVHLKVEGANPTGSFKDRGMTMAISKAVEAGSQAVICASTGNTSASAAAYAARAGLTCAVLVPTGKIALGKLAQALVHGAKLLQVDGNFDDCLELARELSENYPVTLVN